MDSVNIAALGHQVLWATLALSTLFGAVTHRTHFCTMGAVSDIVNMEDWTRMRQWALAVAVAMMGVGLLAYAGQIDVAKTIYASTRWFWLSALVGGLLFGFGMVLASGCGSKTLVRIGGGSLKSLVVFLVTGIAAFATLKGITAVVRVETVDKIFIELSTQASVPAVMSDWLGMQAAVSQLVFALLIGAVLSVWALAGREFCRVSNLVAGCAVGGVIIAMWWVSAHWGYVAEHPDTLQEVFLMTNSGKAEAFSFMAPMAYTLDWLMFFSDKSKVLTLGIVSVVGVVVGAFLSAVTEGSFRWEGFGSAEDVGNHLIGGVLMGTGGVTALGCTVGQGLSGLSMLNLTSFVAVAAIIGGAVLALRYQMWRLEQTG